MLVTLISLLPEGRSKLFIEMRFDSFLYALNGNSPVFWVVGTVMLELWFIAHYL